MDLANLTTAILIAGAISAMVAGLTQVTKLALETWQPVKGQAWLPIVPLFWGVVIALLAATDYAIGTRILGGLMCGLTAMGLYSGGKAALGK